MEPSSGINYAIVSHATHLFGVTTDICQPVARAGQSAGAAIRDLLEGFEERSSEAKSRTPPAGKMSYHTFVVRTTSPLGLQTTTTSKDSWQTGRDSPVATAVDPPDKQTFSLGQTLFSGASTGLGGCRGESQPAPATAEPQRGNT